MSKVYILTGVTGFAENGECKILGVFTEKRVATEYKEGYDSTNDYFFCDIEEQEVINE